MLSTDGNAVYWVVAEEPKVDSGYFVSQCGFKSEVQHLQPSKVSRCKTPHPRHYKQLQSESWMERFRGVTTKHLANYLGWCCLLDRFKDWLTPEQFLFRALRTTYQ